MIDWLKLLLVPYARIVRHTPKKFVVIQGPMLLLFLVLGAMDGMAFYALLTEPIRSSAGFMGWLMKAALWIWAVVFFFVTLACGIQLRTIYRKGRRSVIVWVTFLFLPIRRREIPLEKIDCFVLSFDWKVHNDDSGGTSYFLGSDMCIRSREDRENPLPPNIWTHSGQGPGCPPRSLQTVKSWLRESKQESLLADAVQLARLTGLPLQLGGCVGADAGFYGSDRLHVLEFS